MFGGFSLGTSSLGQISTCGSQSGEASSEWKLSLKHGLPPSFKKIGNQEIPDRRAKGLCFNCDETFTPGHRCKKLLQLEAENWGIEDEAVAEACACRQTQRRGRE